MPFPIQRREIDVGNAPDPDVIQREGPLDMRRAAPLVEIGLTEIASFTVQSDAQLRAAFGLGELDVYVIAVNYLFEQLDCLFRAHTGFNRMVSLTKSVDEALFLRSIRVWWWRRRIFRHFFHLFSKTERPHIRPDFLDESQTIGLRPDCSYILPS